MVAQGAAQSLVQQVRRRVVALDGGAGRTVDGGVHGGTGSGQFAADEVAGVDDAATGLHRVFDVDAEAVPLQHAAVPHLAARLGVERCFVEHDTHRALHRLDVDGGGVRLEFVVADEPRVPAGDGVSHPLGGPKASLGRVAAPLALMLEFTLEAVGVDMQAALACHQLGQVEGKAVRVVEPKRVGAGDVPLVAETCEDLEATIEGVAEGFFLRLDHHGDVSRLGGGLREHVRHRVGQGPDQLVDEGFVLVELTTEA